MKFWEIFFDKKMSLSLLRVFLCAHIIIIIRAQTRRESHKIRFAFDDDDDDDAHGRNFDGAANNNNNARS